MVDFYAALLNPIYKDIDTNAGVPFPDAASLGITLPDEECRILSIKEDLAEYMQNPQKSIMPVIKIVFPDDIPSALVLATAIPRPLLDAALLKVRNFLRTQNNMNFFQRRLLSQMQGKEGFLRDALNMVSVRPLDCIPQIQASGEFISYFWSSFCSAVKSELRKKNDFLSIDIAVFQAVYIIEAFSTLFKEIMIAEREKEMALKALETAIDQPPYAYTMEEIFKFTDSTGRALLGQYTEEDLKEYLNSKSTAADGEELSSLLIYRNKKGEQIFINKQKVFLVCARLAGEARNQIRKALGTRWLRLMRDFNKEPAMENDEQFHQLLTKYVLQFVPDLIYLLRDKRTFLIQCETERSQGGVPLTARFYNPVGILLPMGTLLMLNRKDLLTDARILLPVWYSIPVLSAIFAFFSRLFSGNKNKPQKKETSSSEKEKAPSQEQAIKATAAQIVQKLSAGGKSPEASMADLEKRWHVILNKESKQHLITDIKSLIKDRLRRNLRLNMNQKISEQIIDDLAASIYVEAPVLKKLGDQESLITYIKLYIAKLLLTTKF
ncbi:MAG: hypothetical protein LBP81_02895 [Treponema sp.]|nr:hypothetical protein [Treponema sp.]